RLYLRRVERDARKPILDGGDRPIRVEDGSDGIRRGETENELERIAVAQAGRSAAILESAGVHSVSASRDQARTGLECEPEAGSEISPLHRAQARAVLVCVHEVDAVLLKQLHKTR